LDTGAGITVLNTQVFPDIKTQPFRNDPKNPVRLVAPPPRILLGTMELATPGYCAATDLSAFTKLEKVPVAGIIGWPAADHRTLQLDFLRHHLRFFDSDRRPHPEWGMKKKMRLKDGDWYSTFDLNGQPTELQIDTGSNSFIQVSKTLFNSLHATPISKEDTEIGHSIRGSLSAQRFFLKSLRLNGEYFVDAPVAATGWSFSLVGTGYLDNFMVTLDFENNLLYLRPIRGPNPAASCPTTADSETKKPIKGDKSSL
jgi:predicted aspartyl protease